MEHIGEGKRSISQDMPKESMSKYNQVIEKSLKRERSTLSHSRYNKMKQLILKEVRDAIQEADVDPTASVAEFNLI